MAYANPSFIDGDYSTAKPGSTSGDGALPEFEAPIPGIATKYLFTQKWQMSRNAADAGAPVPYNTPHPAYANYYLVEEGPHRSIGGGMVEFSRKYAAIPATHFEWPMFGYSFIGLTTAIPPGAQPPILVTRSRRMWTVKSRIQYDYFLVPNPGGNPIAAHDPITGDDYNVQTPGDIEDILDMQYVSQATINGAILGGIVTAVDNLNLAASALPTWPTSEQYNAMIADALKNAWNGTVSIVKLFDTNTIQGVPPNGGHMAGAVDTVNSVQGGIIPAEPARLERWMGNIYQRATRYVLAR